MGHALKNAPFAPKTKTPLPPKKDNHAKDAICHQCGEVGHWRMNYPVYLTELMKKKKLSQGASTLASQVMRDAYNALYDAQNEVACLMLGSISLELQRALENYKAYNIIQELKSMFKEQAKQELFETVKAFHACKQEDDKKKPRGAKGKDKGKTKLVYAPKTKIPPPPKRYNLTKDSIFYHCNEGLRERKKLKHGALSLYIGNGMHAKVEAIRSFDLILPSGLIIVLDNYHFAPTVHGVVSISCLVKNGYTHTFANYGISVLKDILVYFNAILHNGIYEIDMHNLYPNVSSMFNVSKKRAKRMLDSSYLWHCRLGHINKKRIDKIQRDGILKPTHNESLEKCKSCISGKMASEPFPHQVERAKDLLGLIHTDVCGPFRNVSREGASYFITFTDDFSHYGYVYLMKHKHEVFETYKVFQNEVKNQLGKRIKAIRSDRGGEYLSREFVKHMESCGYPKETMGYYFYNPLENKIFVAQNVEFFENNLIVQEASGSHGLLKSSGSDEGLEIIQEKDTKPSKNTSKEHNEVAHTEVEPQNVGVPIRRPARIPQEPDIYGFYVDVEEHELEDLNEPPNYKTALSDPKFDKWIEAMNTEMQSMKDNQAHTFKARLVAKGYTQTYNVDYGETFSPVADIRAIKILLAMATYYDYEIWQMDVKTTFLNGHLSEDVYMVQPEGFEGPKHPNKVCKLQHSIYGLKQASRSWNKRFDVEIKKIGFTQNPEEPCVYLKSSGSSVAFLVLYVDDILLMVKKREAAYILGIKIIRDRSKRSIALSQSAYLEKTLKKFKMENSKKGYTPMIEKADYSKSQGAKHLVRYNQNHEEIHWTVVKTILKYLKNTKDMVLVYGAKPKAELKVSCYADASFQTNKDDTMVCVHNGGAMDWKSAKQSTTAMSSIKAEYIVAAEASMEAIWMRKFIDGLRGVMPSYKRPMEMLCNNEPAIAIVDDPGILKGAKHFQRKYHYIREVIQERKIVLKKVYTDDNVADPLTKPMPVNKQYEHARAIGIVPASSLM
nr:retrotransposon protein, putative, Ty1-copia subclass [Tanacetum cinerariifolium]